MHFLEFEKPIAEIEGKIAELRHLSEVAGTSITDEILKLQSKASKDLKTTYKNLNPWQYRRRHWKAVCIQKWFRGVLGRRKARRRKFLRSKYRRKQINA